MVNARGQCQRQCTYPMTGRLGINFMLYDFSVYFIITIVLLLSFLFIYFKVITPGANLTYLAPPRTIFHGCQIVHWDPRNAKNFCPQR